MGDGVGQAVLLIIYKTGIGNLEGVYLALSQGNKGGICESYLSPMEKDDPGPEHKMVGRSPLIATVFQEHAAQL